MNHFVCKVTECDSAGYQYSSKYALEKHQRNHHPTHTSDTLLPGKRKRGECSSSPSSSGDKNNNTSKQDNFSGFCVCGIHMRDIWTLTRHISKCPIVVPSKDALKAINFKTLRVPTDEELVNLKQAMAPLSSGLKASICLSTGICIPGFFPIICNSNKGLVTSTYNEFGLTGETGLKTLWEIVEEEPLIQYESFLIKLKSGKEAFVPSNLLIPPKDRSDLHVSFKSSHVNGVIEISREALHESPHEEVHLDILDDEPDDKSEIFENIFI